MIDKVFIRDLTLHTIIGVYDWEQAQIRPLVLDLDLMIDTRAAAASDQLRDALDYAAVAKMLQKLAAERRFQLIETFAETAARQLFAQFDLDALRLSVGKPGAVPEARTVGVEIHRQRADYVGCGC